MPLFSSRFSISIWNQDKYQVNHHHSLLCVLKCWNTFDASLTICILQGLPLSQLRRTGTRKPCWIPPQLPGQLKPSAIYCQTILSSALSHCLRYGSTARRRPWLSDFYTSTKFITVHPTRLRFLHKYLSKWSQQFAWSVHPSHLPHRDNFLPSSTSRPLTKQCSPLAKWNSDHHCPGAVLEHSQAPLVRQNRSRAHNSFSLWGLTSTFVKHLLSCTPLLHPSKDSMISEKEHRATTLNSSHSYSTANPA